MCHRPQPVTKWAVVIGPHVPRHPARHDGTVDRSGRLVDEVGPSADERGSGIAYRLLGIGGTLGVLVRELHAVVQSGVAAPHELGAGTVHDGGRRDTDASDAVRLGDGSELGHVRGVERLGHRLRSPHGDEA